jgi:DNA-binding NarL/FixJ family response regulator
LCNELREAAPECKLILMCSDQDEKTIEQVIDAMGKNYIDDFVFFDVTIDYLASKLKSI